MMCLKNLPLGLRRAALAALPILAWTPSSHAANAADGLTLPPGFSIAVFAHAPNARSLTLAAELGVVFVSTRGDTVYAIPLHDDDGAMPTYPVLHKLKSPNGIAWKDGYLYIAERHRLTRYHVPTLDAFSDAKAEILSTALPDKSWHGNRYATFGADGALYVGVGAACNVCSLHGLEGSIVKFSPPHWNQPQIVATGVRNTVGLDVNPRTDQIFSQTTVPTAWATIVRLMNSTCSMPTQHIMDFHGMAGEKTEPLNSARYRPRTTPRPHRSAFRPTSPP